MIKLVSKKNTLLVVGKESCLWYSKGRLFVSNDVYDNKLTLSADLLSNFIGLLGKVKKLIYRVKWLERILRLQPRSCIAFSGGFCFAYNRFIFVVGKDGIPIDISSVRFGMSNPLNIVSIEGIDSFSGLLVYGEYGGNEHSEAVSIMRFEGKTWKSVYCFEPKTVKHIHNIIPDKKNKCVYIFTGDSDSESVIWKATNDFKTVEPFLGGKQMFRSCAGIIENEKLIYATDTPIEDNYLFETDNNKKMRCIQNLPGSVINSSVIGECWWFATAVEQDSSLPMLSHCISRRIGPGIKDRYVHVFRKEKEKNAFEETRFEKDFHSMWLFQFGNVWFVNNYRDCRVFINPIAVKKYNQCTLEIKG